MFHLVIVDNQARQRQQRSWRAAAPPHRRSKRVALARDRNVIIVTLISNKRGARLWRLYTA